MEDGERERERTYTNQSTAQRRDTSCTGALMAVRTMIMRNRAALGTEALATLAAVEVSLVRERERARVEAVEGG